MSLTGGADPRNLAEEDGLSEENAAAGTPVLCPRSLRASDEFFTEDNVYYAEINAPFYQSVPGMLTGLGIFFTFVGLAARLSERHELEKPERLDGVGLFTVLDLELK